jgi:hypothetical protein
VCRRTSGTAPDALRRLSGRDFLHFTPHFPPTCARSASLSRENRPIPPPYHANAAEKHRFCRRTATLRAHLTCGRIWPKSRGWLKRHFCRNPARFTVRCRESGPRGRVKPAVNGFFPGSSSGTAPDALRRLSGRDFLHFTPHFPPKHARATSRSR